VRTASKLAFEALSESDTPAAMDALCKLIGVGPATAAAILSCIDSSGATCFMGDESMLCYSEKVHFKYDTNDYCELQEELQEVAERLGGSWTVRDVEHALFAKSMEQFVQSQQAAAAAKSSSSGSKKRSSGSSSSSSSAAGSKRTRRAAS
jgi:hypothetical protein